MLKEILHNNYPYLSKMIIHGEKYLHSLCVKMRNVDYDISLTNSI
jgi:hypothetical protein